MTTTPTAPLSQPRHLAYIDMIRGTAFLAVLIIHSVVCVGRFPGSKILFGGVYGVELFFLASAVTLCFSMSARKQTERFPVIFFFLRRLFRIAPLYWLGLLFYWAFPSIIPGTWLGRDQFEVHPSYYLLTALFINGWNPYAFNSIVPGGWSISVEMTFYLLFPLLNFYLNNIRRAAVAVFIGILGTRLEILLANHFKYALFGNIPQYLFESLVDRWLPTELTVFLIGILTHHLLRQHLIKSLVRSRFWSAGFLLFCALLMINALQVGGGVIPIQLTIALVLAGGIIALSGSAIPGLVNPIICYIGKISFSCYLFHFAALGTVLKIVGYQLGHYQTTYDRGSSLGNFILFLEIFTMTLLLTIPVATLTHRLIENPGINLGRKLIQKLNASHQAASATPADFHPTKTS